MKKYSLFIDTATKTFYCACFSLDSPQRIFCFQTANNVETCNVELIKALQQAKISFNQIYRVYLTLGPGSYTGLRIGGIICRTLSNLTNTCSIFAITSLRLQAANQNVISVISNSDQRKNIGIYNDGKLIYQTKLDHYADEINDLVNRFKSFPLRIDYQEIDLFNAFDYCRNYYQPVSNWQEIKLVYELK